MLPLTAEASAQYTERARVGALQYNFLFVTLDEDALLRPHPVSAAIVALTLSLFNVKYRTARRNP